MLRCGCFSFQPSKKIGGDFFIACHVGWDAMDCIVICRHGCDRCSICYRDGRTSCSRKDLHGQEADTLSELDWNWHQRYLGAVAIVCGTLRSCICMFIDIASEYSSFHIPPDGVTILRLLYDCNADNFKCWNDCCVVHIGWLDILLKVFPSDCRENCKKKS